jgi:lipopolysaccharide transport system ATP-binding protein
MEGNVTDVAVSCRGLSKRYQVGERESYQALRDVIANAVAAPFRRLRSWRGQERDGRPDRFIWALSDFSLEVNRGDVVGIIGRNGAGKSTLLKILARVTKPTTGHAEIHGRIGSLLEVGTGFHPELTGRENIFLNAAILGMRKSEVKRRFDEIVAFAEVEKFVDTPVKRYSSGMYVRLAFAVAAHLEPEILVVDEVLAVGDAAFQRKCLGKMRNIAGEGRTVLFVSHNFGAVQNLCTRGAVLEAGKTVFTGSADDALGFYHRSILDLGANAVTDQPHVLFQGSTDGKRTADAEIVRIEMLDPEGNPKPVVSTWETVVIRLTYRSRKDIDRASVVLQVASAEGAKLLLLSTQPDSVLPISLREGEYSVECVLESLPFSAGDYIIGAGLAIPHVEWLTWTPELARMRVSPRDVYNSGLAPASSRSLIAARHFWRLV